MKNPTNGVPLPQAALALRMSRDRTMRLVLTGELEGWQGAGGRWFIAPMSIEKYRAAQQQETPAATATA